MRFVILLCLLSTLGLTVSARAEIAQGSTINFMRSIEAMRNGETSLKDGMSTIYFRDCTIKFNRDLDNEHDVRFDNGGPTIYVKYPVVFDNCVIPDTYWYLFRNVVFENRVSFAKCEGLRLKFRDCVFKHLVMMDGNKTDFADFKNCRFENGIRMYRQEVSDHIKFDSCSFNLNPYLIAHPGFDTVKYVIRKTSEFPQLFEFANRGTPVDVEITHCNFSLPDEYRGNHRFLVDMSSSIYNNLRFMDNTSTAPVRFAQSTVQNQFMCYGCDFQSNLLLEAFSFNTVAAKVQWASFAGRKISIQAPGSGEYINGSSASELKDEFLYSTLITAYSTFYSAYKSQGNMISANKCYIEWKDIETIFLSHEVERHFSMNQYFNWLMNVFLRMFCDYGANPVKALFWSVYVMVVFGLVYFFMPYQSGLYKQESFFQKVRLYMDYFAHHKTLLEIFNEQEIDEPFANENYREYRHYCEEHGVRLPWYFKLFNRQFFSMGVAVYRTKRWLVRRVSSLAGTWPTQRGLRKAFIATTIACIVFVTVFSTVMFRLIDACTTSLNAFSTLGFGEIPVLGIARHLAVVEGFIGWFLLSIFSVALISQVIQ